MKPLFVLVLLTGCAATPPDAPPSDTPRPETPQQETPAGPAGCSKPYDDYHESRITGTSTVALYAERCNGGLYLVDAASKELLLRVNEGWWHEELLDAEMQDEAILVRSTFITGIGPTGTVPFEATFRIDRSAGGAWQATELPRDDSQPTWLSDRLIEVSNAEQLKALALTNRQGPVALDVDFSEQRLLLHSLWLTSGSIKVTNVRVHRNRRGYYISYGTRSPGIGTHDMKHVVLYAVLPADARSVSVEDPELDAVPFNARTGVIERARFSAMPSP